MSWKRYIGWIFFIGLIVNLTNISIAEIKYYKIEVKLTNSFGMEEFIYYGFDYESLQKKSDCIEFIADSDEMALLGKMNIDFKIISDELVNNYQSRYDAFMSSKKAFLDRPLETGFKLGSMKGYFTLNETYQQFDSLKIKYQEYFLSTDTIGFSIEHRPIIVYKFGSIDNVNEVLLTALHHAREPGGASVLIYFLYDLLEKARSGDLQAGYLLNNRTIYVIPVVNPDGLMFNQTNYPNGGGLWRKNRRQFNDSTFGVDLNRNYGPYELWNAPINGSSTKQTDQTYRGTEPFSEPEIQAVRDFIQSKNIKLCLNYHTFGNLLIYPFGALAKETIDSVFFRNLTSKMTSDNRYITGLDKETVNYSSRGASDDWMYWTDTTKKKKIFALTCEVGKLSDNFWATPDRILEQCYENVNLLYDFLWSAEVNWVLTKTVNLESDSDFFETEFRNIGTFSDLNRIPGFLINSLDSDYDIVGQSSVSMKDRLLVSYAVKSLKNEPNGKRIKIEFVLTESDIQRRDTVEISVGRPGYITLFKDEELFGSWKEGKWGKEYDNSKQRYVLSDSPGGYYSNSDTNYLESNEPLLLSFNYAELQYEAFWEIEPNYDFATIEISTDTAKTWKKLVAKKMVFGPGLKGDLINQDESGYTGYSHTWVMSAIPLTNYLGKNILLRFGMLSDKASNANGIFLDNIRIKIYSDLTNVNDSAESEVNLFPNPSFEGQTIKLKGVNVADVISVTNVIGNSVDFEVNNESDEVKLNNCMPGMYFINIQNSNQIKIFKVIRY